MQRFLILFSLFIFAFGPSVLCLAVRSQPEAGKRCFGKIRREVRDGDSDDDYGKEYREDRVKDSEWKYRKEKGDVREYVKDRERDYAKKDVEEYREEYEKERVEEYQKDQGREYPNDYDEDGEKDHMEEYLKDPAKNHRENYEEDYKNNYTMKHQDDRARMYRSVRETGYQGGRTTDPIKEHSKDYDENGERNFEEAYQSDHTKKHLFDYEDEYNEGSTESNDEKADEDTFCQPFPSIVLKDSRIRRFENGSLLHEGVLYPLGYHRTLNNETRGCICSLRNCVRKCCPSQEILGKGARPNCTEPNDGKFVPDLSLERHQLAPELEKTRRIGSRFFVISDKSCSAQSYMLEPELFEEDNFRVQTNGSLRTVVFNLPPWNYCLDWHESFTKIVAVICLPLQPEPVIEDQQAVFNVGMIVSVPFLLVTFLVYAVIPELRNLYGKTLMCYVACLVMAYCFLILAQYVYFPFGICATIAFTIHFSFLASFFWLNVMCFDIWWTFGGFRSLQGSVKQRERKKFIMYSIYAWGSASLLTGICIVMDFVPSVPKNFIKPEFGVQSCWFTTDAAKAIYFYGPMGVTVVCNICLFVSTALKIVRHKKDTAHHLKGTDSRRHDDNKQWFNLYLKLFIVMGINWSMEIISWLCKSTPQYVWYITDLANTLQGLIIFLIFVWKDKIKRLLLKRLGCTSRDVLSRNSTRSAYHSTASRTCTTSVPLQEKVNPFITETSYRSRAALDDSDCA